MTNTETFSLDCCNSGILISIRRFKIHFNVTTCFIMCRFQIRRLCSWFLSLFSRHSYTFQSIFYLLYSEIDFIPWGKKFFVKDTIPFVQKMFNLLWFCCHWVMRSIPIVSTKYCEKVMKLVWFTDPENIYIYRIAYIIVNY